MGESLTVLLSGAIFILAILFVIALAMQSAVFTIILILIFWTVVIGGFKLYRSMK